MESSDQSYEGIVVASVVGAGVLFAKIVHSKSEAEMILGREIIQMLKGSNSTVGLVQSIDTFGTVVITARCPDIEGADEIEYRLIQEK